MQALKDFEDVYSNLKLSKKGTIIALHKFIFQSEGDRNNRKRLREFTGFSYDENSREYNEKIKYVTSNLNSADLISICNILNLDYNKDDLARYIFRNLLQNALLQDIIVDDDEKGEEDEEENNDGNISGDSMNDGSINNGIGAMNISSTHEGASASMQRRREMDSCVRRNDEQRSSMPRFTLNFNDVENSIQAYDGKGGVSIQSWVKEFEEMAELMQWDDLQKLIFAKRSLGGLAKMFVSGERGLTTWQKLKTALINEFGEHTNSAKLHEMLINRKQRKDETVSEYFYIMKEIASKGNLEEAALIQYIIDGIRDLNANKAILYGTNNIQEFKKKISHYETFTAKQKTSNFSRVAEKKNYQNNQKEIDTNTVKKCYNCGVAGHISSECKNKAKGTKCFNCNKYGHLSRNCPSKKEENNSTVRRILHAKENMMLKAAINEISVNALFDTGSRYNIVNETLYEKLNLGLTPNHITLYGFGNRNAKNGVASKGSIECKITINEQVFDITFLVVPNKFMDIECIIGENFCKNKTVIINDCGIHIKSNMIVQTTNDNSEDNDNETIPNSDHSVAQAIEQPDIMKIDFDCEPEINIDHHASIEARRRVTELIENYAPMKIKSTNISMKIVLKDESPIYSRPYRLPLSERKFIDEQVEKWLNEDIIEPSDSEFSSPVILVKKKDGAQRLCVDYRRINKVMVKDRYPLPLIEDQLDNLKGGIVFITIDLKNGFFHVPVHEDSRKYTSFITHSGQYQFKRVPFGLCNSPSVFQGHINSVFKDLTKEGFAFPYIDDLIITASNDKEAVEKLEKVLATAKDYGLQLNIKKCQFLKREVEFLGHIIQNNKILPSPRKVDALLKYEIPKNAKEVQRFLGLAGYFRKFIHNFSITAKPLSDLLKQNSKFVLKPEVIQSFEALKQALCQKPVLAIYNPNGETELHTDASIEGYGAILLQKSNEDGVWHPVYFMSKKTTPQERNYSSYELEVVAIVEALKKFRVYLLGIPFKIITDCNAFTKTMEKRDLSTRIARWILLLQEFKYTVEHRSGSKMRHVDALSRHPVMTVTEENILPKLKRAQSNDDSLKPIFQILRQNSNYGDYYLKSDILYKQEGGVEKIVVPKNLEYEIIKTAHNKGHFGVKKTRDLICHEYFIHRLDEKIQKSIENCVTCILNNRKRGKQEGELNPLPKPDTPLHTYHIDFMGPLDTTSKLYKHVLVVADSFTKFCWLYPTKNTTAACVINKLSLQSVTFGNPSCIISDRGAAFTGDDFKQYCEAEGIRHVKVTTGLPRANGQVERMNAVIAAVLAKCSIKDPTKWYRHVEAVQRYINSSFSSSTTFTPFELLVGVKMKLKEDLRIKELVEEEIKEAFNDDRNEMRQEAKRNILKMQEENRRGYNKKRKPAKLYLPGELVAIKRTQLGGGLKLRPKYLGPYEITRVKKNNTYDVRKIGVGEGPIYTTTCAEYMIPWPDTENPFETNE